MPLRAARPPACRCRRVVWLAEGAREAAERGRRCRACGLQSPGELFTCAVYGLNVAELLSGQSESCLLSVGPSAKERESGRLAGRGAFKSALKGATTAERERECNGRAAELTAGRLFGLCFFCDSEGEISG